MGLTRTGLASAGLFAATVLATPAWAAPTSWTVPGSGFWDDAANWSGGSLPGSTDDALIDFGDTGTAIIRQDPKAPSPPNPFTKYVVTSLVANAAVELAGGNLAALGNVDFNRAFTWSGGLINIGTGAGGTWTFTQGLHLTAADLVGAGAAAFELRGHSLLEGGRGILASSTAGHLAAGATLEIRAGDLLGFKSFDAEGDIERTAGTGDFVLQMGSGALNGHTHVGTGRLTVLTEASLGVSQSGGSFVVDQGAALRFASGHTVTGSIGGSGDLFFDGFGDYTVDVAQFKLTGTVHVDQGAKFNWNGDGEVGSLNISAGTLIVDGRMDVNGRLSVPGIVIVNGNAVTHIIAHGGIDLEGNFTQNAGLIELGGTSVFGKTGANTVFVVAGATLHVLHGAEVRLVNDSDVNNHGAIGGGGSLINDGLLRRDTATGEYIIAPQLTNNGRLELATGTLRLRGGFTQSASGELALHVAGGGPLIDIAGPSHFDGLLEIDLGGGLLTGIGDSLELLHYDTFDGSFALSVLGAGQRVFAASYGEHALTLTVTDILAAPVPVPATFVLQGSGVLLLAAVSRRRRRRD